MTSIVKANYQDVDVSFTEEAWFNATAVAEKFGKRPIDWLNQDGTKEYISALATFLQSEPKSLWKTKKGGKPGNAGTWMHPRLGVPFARWLDVNFGVWCDDQIYQILTSSHPHYDWKKMRSASSSSFKVMNEVLQMRRNDDGKSTGKFNYMNEAKLVNWALKGKFEGLDRDALSRDELELLAKLEERNAVLIGRGLDRDSRKIALDIYAQDWRSAKQGMLEEIAKQTLELDKAA